MTQSLFPTLGCLLALTPLTSVIACNRVSAPPPPPSSSSSSSSDAIVEPERFVRFTIGLRPPAAGAAPLTDWGLERPLFGSNEVTVTAGPARGLHGRWTDLGDAGQESAEFRVDLADDAGRSGLIASRRSTLLESNVSVRLVASTGSVVVDAVGVMRDYGGRCVPPESEQLTCAPVSRVPQNFDESAKAVSAETAASPASQLPSLAKLFAPGAVAVGAVEAGAFQTGQGLMRTFEAEPGKCYSVIGTGVGIEQLELTATYVTLHSGTDRKFGSAKGGGSQVVLGAGDHCSRSVSTLVERIRVILTASKGDGVGVFRVYVR